MKTYERAGLRRTGRGRPTYSEDDVERLARALGFKELGFTLSQIAALLDASPSEIAAAMAAHYMLSRRAEVEAVRAELRKTTGHRASSLKLVA